MVTKGLPEEIRVAEGDTITLDVEIEDGNRGISPTWVVNGREIDVSPISPRVSLVFSEQIRINFSCRLPELRNTWSGIVETTLR